MLKKIAVKDIKIGMFITDLCGSWMEHPFWRSQFLLNNPDDLKSLQLSDVKEAWIDTDKGSDVDAGISAKTDKEVSRDTEKFLQQAAVTSASERTSMADEIRVAANLCKKSKLAVMEMFSDARMGKAVEFEQAQELVEGIANSVLRHPHALISLARLKTANEYTYMHSVAVCALMIALARQMNMDEAVVRDAGLAGLLHDIGKIAIPDSILNKPGKLTDAEFALIKTHPAEGAKILRDSHSVSEMVMDVCLHHHEKIDGSGYPESLAGKEISLFARMGAVCDVYDAITSNRPYKKGWLPAESIRKMAEWSNGHFDESVFQAFVKTLGIYPVGSLVRLESGRLGVVIEQHETSLLTPKVKIFFSVKSKVHITPTIVDLARLGNADKILGREVAEDWGFRHLDQFWIDQD